MYSFSRWIPYNPYYFSKIILANNKQYAGVIFTQHFNATKVIILPLPNHLRFQGHARFSVPGDQIDRSPRSAHQWPHYPQDWSWLPLGWLDCRWHHTGDDTLDLSVGMRWDGIDAQNFPVQIVIVVATPKPCYVAVFSHPCFLEWLSCASLGISDHNPVDYIGQKNTRDN